MNRLLVLILLSFLVSPSVLAQETETDSESAESTGSTESTAEEAAEPETEVTDEEIDELLGLDEDYAEIEDDDFDFSEEVRFEQSTDFPVDI